MGLITYIFLSKKSLILKTDGIYLKTCRDSKFRHSICHPKICTSTQPPAGASPKPRLPTAAQTQDHRLKPAGENIEALKILKGVLLGVFSYRLRLGIN